MTNESKNIRNKLRSKAIHARKEMPQPYRAHKSSEICKRLEESLSLTLGITGISPNNATVAVYAAFPEEVDLHDFIEAAYGLGCSVAFPCMVRDAWSTLDNTITNRVIPDSAGSSYVQQTMEMHLVSAELYHSKHVDFINNPLKRYNHNDTELQPYPYVSAQSLTMLVVPVVGFDSHGNRLGYGGGNYDRYLTQLKKGNSAILDNTANQNSPTEKKTELKKELLEQTCRIVGVAFSEQQVEKIPTEKHDIPLTILAL